jgi:hypothetical protein
MKKMILFVGLVVIVFLGIGQTNDQWRETEISKLTTLPKDIEIIPPPPSTLPEVAVFSGRWEGFVENVQPMILIVEKIVGKPGGVATVQITRFWGASKYGPGGSDQCEGKIKKGILQIDTSSRKYTLKVGADGKSITGRIEIITIGRRPSNLPYYDVKLQKVE